MTQITTTTPHHDAFTPSRPSQNRRNPQPLFANQAAQAIWNAMLTVDVAIQHEFLARLRERLAVPALHGGADEVRTSRLVAAVREAEDILVSEASEQEAFDPANPPRLDEDAFARLRAGRRDLGWPAPSSLRRWVNGSWNDVRRRALLAPLEGGDAILVASNVSYTWDDIAGAIVAYRDELVERGHPTPEAFTQTDYLGWARLPRVVALPGRRPLSGGPFSAFGGFRAAQAAALGHDQTPARTSTAQARHGLHIAPTSKFGYDDDSLKAALDEVVAYLKGVTPRATDYVHARRRILADEEERGLAPRAFAAYTVLIRRWRPNWDAVLIGCGYEPLYDPDATIAEDGQSVPRAKRRRISDADLIAGIAEAYRVCGRPFTCPTYVAYIKERAHISLTGRPMAGYGVIYQRFNEHAHGRGVFNYVCDLALLAGWDADHTEGLTAPFGNRRPISKDDLFDGLREAFEAIGKPFSAKAYTQYVREHDCRSKTDRPLASYQAIYKRFRKYGKTRGAFNTACDRALPRGWDQPDSGPRRKTRSSGRGNK